MSVLDFLMQTPDVNQRLVPQELDLPSGGDFVPGVVAQFKVMRMFSFMTPPTVDITMPPWGFKADLSQHYPRSDKTRWYWNLVNKDAALLAMKEFGVKFLQNKLVFVAESSTIRGWSSPDKTPESVFGTHVVKSVDLAAPGAKWGKQFHYLVLPSLVQCFGLNAKWLAKPIYNYAALAAVNGDSIDEEFTMKMFGPESKGINIESELGAARAQIWAALGESNVAAWQNGQDAAYSTTSPNLYNALRVLYQDVSIWMRLINVADPDYKARSEDGSQHFATFVISEVYGNEAEAIEAAGGASDDANSIYPPLPDAWKTFSASDWIEWLKVWVAQNKLEGIKDKPEGIQKATLDKLAGNLSTNGSVSVAETLPWLKFV